jgi:hypothetical protein
MLELMDQARAIAAADPALSTETLQRVMAPWTEALRIRLVLLAGAAPSVTLFSRARERQVQA